MGRKKKSEIVPVANKDNILIDQRIDEEKLKKELSSYVDDKVNKVFIDEIDKANRRLIREKSRKIVWKNIVIIFLLAVIGFLTYLLYSNNYFHDLFSKKIDVVDTEKKDDKEEKKDDVKEDDVKPTPTPTPTPVPTPKKPTLDELKKEYGSLIDNYYVTDSSSYLVDFYGGNLSDDLKKYMTLNSLDFNSIKKEDGYQVISNETFKLAYEKLFSDTYKEASFDYDDNKILYVSMMESYMTTSILKKEENNITREITDIKEDNGVVTITTVEGIIQDGKLYEILHNTEIEDYKGDNLVNYQDKLDKVIYTFKNNKLIKLEK